MDWSQVAAVAVAVLTPLSPYLAKAGEEVAKEVGKAVFEKGKAIHFAIRRKFEDDQDEQAQQTLALFERRPETARETLVAQLTQKAEGDTVFAEALSRLVGDARNILFRCLREKFQTRDLKEVYFRMGIGWNDLTGEMAARTEKAMALIEYIETRERLPELIAVMWEVYPGLKC